MVDDVGFVWSTFEVPHNALLVAFVFVAGVGIHCFYCYESECFRSSLAATQVAAALRANF